ncbi:serine protease gd-like isoform X2 [Choristoneura fumiferana]|uniref:serine protease gd-like isoform X2 n=1 Tax=Choristoneura fumiferana TaxID=7141 RepID=UPI003D154C51
MCRLFYSVLLVLGYLNCLPVTSQYVDSPCPGTFEYKSDGSGIYGLIHLQPNGPITSIHIIANFTIAARLYSNYVGRLEPVSTSTLQLQQFYQNTPIDYRVHFPVTSPLPRLTNLIVNNNVLCYGPADIPQPNLYVTTISLQHKLLLRGVQPGFNNNVNQFQPAVPKPQDPSFNIIGSAPNSNSQVYTFNADNDRTGTWNAVPTLQRPQQSRPQPSPEYFEYTTSTRRPEPQLPPEYYEYTTSTKRPAPPPIPPRPSTPTHLLSSPSNFECGMVSGGNEQVPLIYNGQSYARGDWPWLVAIYKRKDGSLSFVCSGTLVSDRHVVTAAHCVQQRSTITSIKDIVVKVGVYNREDWGDDGIVTRTLASATIHESYNASTFANDLSVFTFDRSVEFNNYIRPACLWSGKNDLSSIVGSTGVVAGWGASELGPGSEGEPRMVRIPVVSTAVCRASKTDFHLLTSSNTLCAGDRNGAGPCLGDSGGGLYLLEGGRWRLRGVVSLSLRPENGDNSCNLNEYIIFTDAAKYLQWINNIMRY